MTVTKNRYCHFQTRKTAKTTVKTTVKLRINYGKNPYFSRVTTVTTVIPDFLEYGIL